jgi:hypothetical protein
MTNEQILDAANGDLDKAIQLLDLFREQPSIEKPVIEENSTQASR